MSHEALPGIIVAIAANEVVHIHEKEDEATTRTIVAIHTSVNGAAVETKIKEDDVEAISPLTSSLAQTIEGFSQLADKYIAVTITVWQVRGHAHIKIFLKVSLKESLLDVELPESQPQVGCEGKSQADGGHLDNSGEHILKITSILLGVAISDKAGLELFDAAVGARFEVKDEVTTHNVGPRGEVAPLDKFKSVVSHDAVPLFVDGVGPVGRHGVRYSIFIALGDAAVSEGEVWMGQCRVGGGRNVGKRGARCHERSHPRSGVRMRLLVTPSEQRRSIAAPAPSDPL